MTQAEEKAEGADFFAKLGKQTRLFAFQFKASHDNHNHLPFRFRIQKAQHVTLYPLARRHPGSVLYVFPYYATVEKLIRHVPCLLDDTWFCDAGQMNPGTTFGKCKSRQIKCWRGRASVNPEFELFALNADGPTTILGEGIPQPVFAEWYREFVSPVEPAEHRNPWITRGLRVAIIPS